jgi:HTH-type transcriptional regulator / antitoxin HigA
MEGVIIMAGTKLKDIETIWPSVSNTLSVPHTKKDYERLCKLLDEIVDVVKSDSKHPLASLMETIGILVSDYEEKHFMINDSSPVSVLKNLMDEHGLKQSDLEVIGSQGVVSEILNGKRELNLRQVKLLAQKFSVSPSVFI